MTLLLDDDEFTVLVRGLQLLHVADWFSINQFLFLEQLAKERKEEQKEAQAKEDSLKAKKKSDPNELKAYSKGVGKFLNPAIKKAAR